MDIFFENKLAEYDKHMLKNINGATEFYKFTAKQLPMDTESKVLDLGCGTGLELEEYFLLNPSVHITGIDLSSAMLNVLAKKFPDKNLYLINDSYFDVPFGDKRYNAAVSVESLHHFTEQQKILLYKKLFHALTQNGYFILTDYFAKTNELEKKYFDDFKKLKQKQNITDNNFYHYDTPLTVAHEIKILEAVGFSDVKILKNWSATYTIKAMR